MFGHKHTYLILVHIVWITEAATGDVHSTIRVRTTGTAVVVAAAVIVATATATAQNSPSALLLQLPEHRGRVRRVDGRGDQRVFG